MTRVLLATALLLAACDATDTVARKDDEAPRAIGAEPAPGASGVAPTAALRVLFAPSTCADCARCDIDPASLEGRLSLTPASATVVQRFDVSACAVTLSVPGGLAPETAYTLSLAAGTRDLAGNESTASFRADFKTGPSATDDATPPRFSGSWPPEGDDRVRPGQPVLVFFDEVVAPRASVTGVRDLVQAPVPARHGLSFLPAEGRWPAGPVTLTVSRVPDRAGNVSTETVSLHFVVPAADDAVAPFFAGAAELEEGPSSLFVAWDPAIDDRSDAATVRYLVHVAPTPELLDREIPSFVTAPGATAVELGLPAEGGLAVLVRAQDEAGNVDANDVVQVLR